MEYKNLHIKELLVKEKSSPKKDGIDLKQHVQELGIELEKVQHERDRLIQDTKITKLNEVMAELKVSKEESKRLKKMLDEILLIKMKNVPGIKGKIESIRLMLENKELVKMLQEQEHELEKLKDIAKRGQSRKKLKIKQGSKKSTIPTNENISIASKLKKIKENLSKRNL